MLITADN